ncbi:MAG: sodium:solute symporter family protein [Rubrobacter sp.]|nr:sodium:solute symporter family protein [Rubrobacter sp.]
MILWQALIVFVILFIVVLVIGLLSYRWRAGGEEGAEDEMSEWGLGGRRFGTVITWFLVGGDLYTAYTLIAVPALVFGMGAIGLFALPYTIIVYPLVFVVMPKLWQVAHNRGMVTPADYVKERFDSPFLALLMAVTGFVATMPYIALQMYGIEIVVSLMGVPVTVSLIIAIAIVALFTFASGLRAPALIALVKDSLIYITIIVVVIYVTTKLGGFEAIFDQVPTAKQNLPPEQYVGFSTLTFGSALALFLYPHAITGIFGSSSQKVIKRNASLLPAYTFLLGLVALMGYMAIAAGIQPGFYGANGIVPQLFTDFFADPLVGFGFAAIAIGAVVPASVMAIAASNLFTRNFYRQYIRQDISSTEETMVSRIGSIIVLIGAVIFVLIAPSQAITLQLFGGVWIVQTLPAMWLALYVRWLDRWAIAAGWLVGMAWGTYGMIVEGYAGGGLATLQLFGLSTKAYVAVYSLVANLLIVFVGSALARYFVSQEQTSYGMLAEEETKEPEGA